MTDKRDKQLKTMVLAFLYLREQAIGVFKDTLYSPSVLPMLYASQYLKLANLLSTLLQGKICTTI